MSRAYVKRECSLKINRQVHCDTIDILLRGWQSLLVVCRGDRTSIKKDVEGPEAQGKV